MRDEVKAVIGGIIIGILVTLCIGWFVMGVSASAPDGGGLTLTEPEPETAKAAASLGAVELPPEYIDFVPYIAIAFGTVVGGLAGMAFVMKWNAG
jgi:hypothetical protein